MNRPRHASTSPLLSAMPPIGVSRRRRGCRAENASICARTSGEALSRNHCWPSALTAAEAWVRGRSDACPARTPVQLAQPQFHCGEPPPAAEPSTRRCNLARLLVVLGLDLRRRGRRIAATAKVLLVRADLGVHGHFGEVRLLPRRHWVASFARVIMHSGGGQGERKSHIVCRSGVGHTASGGASCRAATGDCGVSQITQNRYPPPMPARVRAKTADASRCIACAPVSAAYRPGPRTRAAARFAAGRRCTREPVHPAQAVYVRRRRSVRRPMPRWSAVARRELRVRPPAQRTAARRGRCGGSRHPALPSRPRVSLRPHELFGGDVRAPPTAARGGSGRAALTDGGSSPSPI